MTSPIFLLAENIGCGGILIVLVAVMFLLDSEGGRWILAGLAALAAFALLAVFLVATASPAIYWFAGALAVTIVLHLAKSELFKADDGESLKSRFIKGCRDAAACISVGVGIVVIAQILLRCLFWLTPDSVVDGTEDLLTTARSSLKSVLDIKYLFWAFAVLVPFSVAAPELKILSRYSEIRNWAERIFLVLLTVTSFTFFGVEGIRGFRATLTEKRSKIAAEALARFEEKKREVVAAALWEREIRNASATDRQNLRKLVFPPAPPSRPGPQTDPPTSPPPNESPKRPSTRSEEGRLPSWNPSVASAPRPDKPVPAPTADTPSAELTPADYGRYMAEPVAVYSKVATSGDTPESSPGELNDAVRFLKAVAERRSDADVTLGQLENAETVVNRAAESYSEDVAGFIEVLKNLIEEGAEMSDSSILKPFAKAMIDGVAETLVKTTIPNFIDGIVEARAWVSTRLQPPASYDPGTFGWKDRLSRLFMDESRLQADDLKRKEAADQLLKQIDRHLAEMETADRWERIRREFKTALLKDPASLGPFSAEQERIFARVLKEWEDHKTLEKANWHKNGDKNLEAKFFEFSRNNPRVKACFGFMLQQKDWNGAVAYYTKNPDPKATGKPFYLLKYYYDSTGHGAELVFLYDEQTNSEVGTVCPH